MKKKLCALAISLALLTPAMLHAQGLSMGGVPGASTASANSWIGAPQTWTSGSGSYTFQSLDVTALDSFAPKFNFGVATYAGGTLGHNDTVMCFGWNASPGCTRVDSSKDTVTLNFEDYYQQGGVGLPGEEFHLEQIDTLGVVHRPFSCWMPIAGGANSACSSSIDSFVFNDYAGNAKVQFNNATNNVSFSANEYITFASNNSQVMQQRNAANDAFLPLPYFDASNRLQMGASGVNIGGATPTTGTLPNSFMRVQPSSLPANGHVLDVAMPAVTGDANPFYFSGAFTGNMQPEFFQSGTGRLQELLLVGASSGDAYTSWQINGGAIWSAGINHRSGTDWKLAPASTIGDNDTVSVIVSTNGNFKLPSAIYASCGVLSSAASGLINCGGNMVASGYGMFGSATALTLSAGEVGLAKITASGSAPGAAGLKFEAVCGTNAGSAKIIAYAGTSTTPVTVADNIGAGVTGC